MNNQRKLVVWPHSPLVAFGSKHVGTTASDLLFLRRETTDILRHYQVPPDLMGCIEQAVNETLLLATNHSSVIDSACQLDGDINLFGVIHREHGFQRIVVSSHGFTWINLLAQEKARIPQERFEILGAVAWYWIKKSMSVSTRHHFDLGTTSLELRPAHP